jgi:AcrR family transcriptional regulator
MITALTTRERLLVSARHVVEEGGYGAASVIAIAEHAGVAAGTLYRHFTSKEELFVQLFRDVCDGEVKAMRAAAAASPPDATSVDRLTTVLQTFAERALRNPRLAWALIAEPVDPLVDEERLAYRIKYATLAAKLLRDAIRAGEIPDQDVKLTAAALVGGCGEALVGPLSPIGARKPRTEHVIEALATFIRRAVGASA